MKNKTDKTYVARDPIMLTHNECVAILRNIQAILYVQIADGPGEGIVEEWNPEKEWSADVGGALSQLMHKWRLEPRALEDGTEQFDREPIEPAPADAAAEVTSDMAERRARRAS